MSEFRVDFKSDTANVTKGIKDVQGGLKGVSGIAKGVGASFSAMMAPLLAVTAALGGIAFVANGIKGAIDFGGDMADLSSKTGIAVKDLVILTEAFKLAGMEGADLGKIVNGLSAKLDSPTPKILETMQMLGLSMKDIQKLPIGERFQVVGEAIGNLSSATDRANASQALFGKTMGNNLLVFFNSKGAIEEAKNSLGGLPEETQKYAEDLEKIGDAFDNVAPKMMQFFVGLVGQNIDKLKTVADLIMGIDLTNAGKAIGSFLDQVSDIVKSLTEAFKKGAFGDAISNELEIAWLSVEPLILRIFEMGAETFLKGIGGDFAANFVTGTKELLNPGSESLPNYGFSNGQLVGVNELESNDETRRKARIEELKSRRHGSQDNSPGLMKSFGVNLEESMQNLQFKLDNGFFGPIDKFVGKLGGEWALTPENMQASIDKGLANGKSENDLSGLLDKFFNKEKLKTPLTSLQSIGGASIFTGNPALSELRTQTNELRQIRELLSKTESTKISPSTKATFGP